MGTNEADIAAINALYERWVTGVKTGDLDLFLSVWADDATRMQPEIPAIMGKEQIRAYFEEPFKQFNWDTDVYGEIEIMVSGEWAFSRGNYTLALKPKDGGPGTHFDGKWLDILKKQADGFWKVYIDCVNDNAPPKVE